MYSAGILIYTEINGYTYFLLGRDSKYGTWSDFGGKHEYIDDNDSVNTAGREFYEETCGVLFDKRVITERIRHLKPILCQSYMKNPYYMYIIKIKVNDLQKVSSDFNYIRTKIKYSNGISYKFKEKDKLQWIRKEDICYKPELYRCVFYKSFMKNVKTMFERCVSI